MKLTNKLNNASKKDVALEKDMMKVALKNFLLNNDTIAKPYISKDGSFGIEKTDGPAVIKFINSLINTKIIGVQKKLTPISLLLLTEQDAVLSSSDTAVKVTKHDNQYQVKVTSKKSVDEIVKILLGDNKTTSTNPILFKK